jgi:hypothetical protein
VRLREDYSAGSVGGDIDAPQNLWLGVVEGDFEAENGGGHAARLRRSRLVAQFHGRGSSNYAQDDRRCGGATFDTDAPGARVSSR